MPKKTTPIERAIKEAGGLTKLAAFLDTTPQAVHNWKSRGQVPAKYCLQIEEATNRAVTRYELLPGVFGEPSKAAA